MGLHAGILDLESSGLAGPYAYAVNVAETGAVTAAHATLARVDIVWVRLDDPAESDGSAAPVVVAGYTVGTGGGFGLGGGVPATPARCMVLATIQVPMSGGGSPTVIWVAPFTVAAGAPTPVWSQAERDALTVYNGLQVYRLDLHVVETYNGTAWGNGLGGVSAKTTASVGPGIGTVETVIATAPAITGDGVKRFKITGTCYGVSSSVAGDTFEIRLKDSTTATVLQSQKVACPIAVAYSDGKTIVVSNVPAVGSHVYTFVAIRITGTGAGTVPGSAAFPIEIIVEQIA